MIKVLLIEDDTRLGRNTKELLELENYLVDWVQNGIDAVNLLANTTADIYDVILIDWMLPGLSGIELCKIFRTKYNFQGGIIFVTAKGEMEDCVQALETGSDDFMIKPFKIKELSARIHAVYRRKGKPFVEKIYTQKDISINHNLRLISTEGNELFLRKKEFDLFELLFINMGRLLPREVIFEKIWADKPDTNPESLDSHIYTLRKKLTYPFPQIKIKLVKNTGYLMEISHDSGNPQKTQR